MSTNEHYEAKIQLINNYALCLQRQNQSKNKEIGTLHNHLDIVAKENEEMRILINQLRLKNVQDEPEGAVNRSLQTSFSSVSSKTIQKADISCQTEQEEKVEQPRSVEQISQLQQQMKVKDQQLEHYHSECEQMYEAIVQLEKSLAQKQEQNCINLQRVSQLQHSLTVEQKKRAMMERKYEEVNKTVQSFDEESLAFQDQYRKMEKQMQDLIIKNNRLIEKVRQLQKEKSSYYKQLKKVSRTANNKQNLSSSSMKTASKVKDQRWVQIEANLKKLQRENQYLQSNLKVTR